MSHRNDLLLEKKQYFILMLIVLISAINYGFIGFFNFDLIKQLEKINLLVPKIIHIIISLCGIYLLLNPKTYMPYMTNTLHPCDTITDHVPNNYSEKYKLKVPPNSLVIYWSNEKDNYLLNNHPEPWHEFKNYPNTGILRANEYGIVNLKFQSIKKRNKTFIFYKYYEPTGLLSHLKKLYI